MADSSLDASAPQEGLAFLIWLGSQRRCPPGCVKCAAEYLDSKDDPTFDKDGWPKRWSDSTYLGDGPWGA